jgi:hypothetical protein
MIGSGVDHFWTDDDYALRSESDFSYVHYWFVAAAGKEQVAIHLWMEELLASIGFVEFAHLTPGH